ncbi:hypothetical protein [Candidatus Hodgkinia cicadicola]
MVRITIRYESKKLKCEEKKNISDCERIIDEVVVVEFWEQNLILIN